MSFIPWRLKQWVSRVPQLPGACWHSFVRGSAIDRPPTFIVGCGHSGTSILLAIIGSHSRIYPIPKETYCFVHHSIHSFQYLQTNYCLSALAAGKNRWIEKSPRHIHHIEKIFDWCPEAKILLIIRDGRDVAYSIQQRTGSLEAGITRWVDDNLAGKPFWGDTRLYVVRYESLITEFRSTVEGILTFLGEAYEEAIADYYKTPKRWYSTAIAKPGSASGKNHNQHRNWQINQPMFDGRGRWKALSEEELRLVYSVGGELLRELGYVNSEVS